MAVRSYVRDQLSVLGELEEHHFTSGIDEGANFILKLPGRNKKRRPLLVGAHYDGPVFSIGADDNASGMAALLELARRWAKHPPNAPCGSWPLIKRSGECLEARRSQRN